MYRMMGAAFAATMALASTAQAADLYTDAAAFNARLASSQAITFANSTAYAGSSLTVAGDTFTTNGFFYTFAASNSPATAGQKTGSLDAEVNAPTPLSLNVAVNAQNAIGFYYFDRVSASFEAMYGSYAPLTLTLTVNGSQAFVLAAETQDLKFFGLTSATPITSLSLSGLSGNGYATDIALASGVQSTALNPAQPAAAVPEASTWAMLLVGIGALGVSLRRRARTTAALAA